MTKRFKKKNIFQKFKNCLNNSKFNRTLPNPKHIYSLISEAQTSTHFYHALYYV